MDPRGVFGRQGGREAGLHAAGDGRTREDRDGDRQGGLQRGGGWGRRQQWNLAPRAAGVKWNLANAWAGPDGP